MFLQKDTVIFLCVYKKFEDFFCAVFHFTYFNLYFIFVILMLSKHWSVQMGRFYSLTSMHVIWMGNSRVIAVDLFAGTLDVIFQYLHTKTWFLPFLI